MAMRCVRMWMCIVLVVCMGTWAPLGGTARAELVSTAALLASGDEDPTSQARRRIEAILAREDVRRQLAALGVDPHEVAARVAALSDAEIARLDGRLGDLPAGGDFLGVVAAVLLVTVAILFFTDLLGYTDVFPFVRPLPRGDSKTQ